MIRSLSRGWLALVLVGCGGPSNDANPSETPMASPQADPSPTVPPPAPTPKAETGGPDCCLQSYSATPEAFFYCAPVPPDECKPETWPRDKIVFTRPLTQAELDKQMALYNSTYKTLLDPANRASAPKEQRIQAMQWESCLQACFQLVSDEEIQMD